MARKSKFFRVAVEGATTDGRKIERSWLTQIARSYDPLKFGARIFIEHIRGMNPEWGFRCMGDVVAVKTETVKIDGEDRLALFAQIQPTDEMLALNKAGQKIYSSIEVNPDFAGTGEAYLVGLGITDSPASLGTEILAFAAENPAASPFSARKQAPENLFSAAEFVEIELEDEQPEPGPGLLAKIKDMFKSKGAGDDSRFSDVHSAVEHVAQAAAETSSAVTKLSKDFADLRASIDANKTAHETAIADLSNKIDHTPNNDPKRPAAPGGTGTVTTDC
ncbi:MAG TPA: GPO family capsid scaffolding protein [Lysobacter sp.]